MKSYTLQKTVTQKCTENACLFLYCNLVTLFYI
nr:MAG TPA: hypothetical protein [Caudoviricetes sp.]